MQHQKPPYTSSIAIVKPGQVIPETLLHKLLSENRSAVALTVQEKGKLEIERFGKGTAAGPLDTVEKEMKNLQTILSGSKPFTRMFVFHAFPDDFTIDEVQPFVALKDSKDNPILAVCIEGDFPGRETDGTSEAFDVFDDYLFDKIAEMYSLLGNDWKKVVNYLKGSSFEKDILGLTGHRCVISFMPLEGEPFAVGKNELGGSYDWGTASNVYGYTESAVAAATPAPAEAPAKRSKYAADDDAPAPAVPSVPQTPAAPTVQPEVPAPQNPKPADPIEATAAALQPQMRRVEIPKNLRGKRKKAWFRDLLGELPSDWEKLTHIEVPVKEKVNSLAELAHTKVAPAAAAAETVPKDMRQAEPEIILPVISGQQQAKVTEFIKKYLDGSSNRIENPLELQKLESKVAVFSELCLDNKLDDINTWPTSTLFAFTKSHPEAAALLLIELRRDRLNRMQLKDLAGTGTAAPAPTPKAGTTPAATTTVGTASPVHKASKYG